MTDRCCPACESSDADHLVTVPLVLPELHPLGSSLTVVTCVECGTGFTDAAVSQAAYDAHYARTAKYADEGHTNAGSAAPDTPWNVARQQAIADRLLSWVPPDARLVDVGCATGSLLVALAERGMRNVVGLDPSARSAEVAAERGVTVLTGALSDIPADLGIADVVTMNGVFEHLWDTGSALRGLTSMLRRGATLYVEIPDASKYCHPYVAPYQDFNTEHVNHLSPSTLDRLLRRYGFEPLWQEPSQAELGPGFSTATTTGAWRFTGAPTQVASGRDTELVGELGDFADRSARDLAALSDLLDERLGHAREVVVWGIGEYAYKLLALPPLASRDVVALIDGNPSRQGMYVGGVKVTGPHVLDTISAPVVISSVLAENSIRADLKRRNAVNKIVSLSG